MSNRVSTLVNCMKFCASLSIAAVLISGTPGPPAHALETPRLQAAGYYTAMLGKWHLTTPNGASANLGPCTIGGWPSFAGSLPGQVADYNSWTKVISDAGIERI